MSHEQVQVERRAAQRFDVHLPLSVRIAGSDGEGCGFTQNLCARGALFHTDLALSEGDFIELTLVMPSEITLAENMRVRCPGKVLRVLSSAVGNRAVVAVQLARYEFMPETNVVPSDFARVSALHERHHEEADAHRRGSPTPRSLLP